MGRFYCRSLPRVWFQTIFFLYFFLRSSSSAGITQQKVETEKVLSKFLSHDGEIRGIVMRYPGRAFFFYSFTSVIQNPPIWGNVLYVRKGLLRNKWLQIMRMETGPDT